MASTSHTSPKETSRRPDSEVTSASLSRKVHRGALWSIGSAIQLRTASIITTAIVAHILDPRDFGIFAVAMTAYTIIFGLGEFGIGACLVRADLDIEALAPTLNTLAVTTSILQAAAMIEFAGPIARALGSPAAARPIRAMALVVVIIGLSTIPTARIFRDFRQNRVFLAEATSVVISTATLLLLAKSGSGAMAFAWSRVIGQFISGCVVFASAAKNYRFGFTAGALSVLFRIGIPLGFSGFVGYLLLNVDYALIGHTLGPSALGIYVIAFNVAMWPASLLGFMISNVAMPAFSRVKGDQARVAGAVTDALRAVSLVVMPISGLTMVLAHPLVTVLYGQKWGTSARVLSILVFYGAISLVCQLFSSLLAGLGQTKMLVAVQTLWLAVLIPGMLIGISTDGIFGAAYAHVVVIGVIVLPCYFLTLRKAVRVRVSSVGRALSGALIASIMAALAAHSASDRFGSPLAQLVVGLAAGGVVYGLAMAPRFLQLLNSVQHSRTYGTHILRLYSNAAQVLRMPGASSPRHAAGRVTQSAAGGPDRVRVVASFASPSAASQLAALDLLVSLATPVSPVYMTRFREKPVHSMVDGRAG